MFTDPIHSGDMAFTFYCFPDMLIGALCFSHRMQVLSFSYGATESPRYDANVPIMRHIQILPIPLPSVHPRGIPHCVLVVITFGFLTSGKGRLFPNHTFRHPQHLVTLSHVCLPYFISP